MLQGIALQKKLFRLAQSGRLEGVRDALFRIRRARHSCRTGLLDLACQDYLAILENRPQLIGTTWIARWFARESFQISLAFAAQTETARIVPATATTSAISVMPGAASYSHALKSAREQCSYGSLMSSFSLLKPHPPSPWEMPGGGAEQVPWIAGQPMLKANWRFRGGRSGGAEGR